MDPENIYRDDELQLYCDELYPAQPANYRPEESTATQSTEQLTTRQPDTRTSISNPIINQPTVHIPTVLSEDTWSSSGKFYLLLVLGILIVFPTTISLFLSSSLVAIGILVIECHNIAQLFDYGFLPNTWSNAIRLPYPGPRGPVYDFAWAIVTALILTLIAGLFFWLASRYFKLLLRSRTSNKSSR